MKTAKLGDFLIWKGEICEVTGETRERSVIIKMLRSLACPHCGEEVGEHSFSVIPTSPQFQENAEPIQTITNSSERCE